MESRSEKFKRIATRRTNEIIDKIRILGNCSNKSTYEYSSEEVSKIFKSIEQELNSAKNKFSNKKVIFKL
jgi:ABC-type Fe3+-hydroxamate transport system substrate-binding protein